QKWVIASLLVGAGIARAGQIPGAASDADVPISHHDRVYAAEQFSNSVSVTDPVDNKLLGLIRLGDPAPGNLSPLYRGQLLVHGLGFSPDSRALAVVSIGSNSVSFIDLDTGPLTNHVNFARTAEGTFAYVTVGGLNEVQVFRTHGFSKLAAVS